MGTGLLLADKGVVIAISEGTYGTDAVNAAILANSNLTYLAVHDDMQVALSVVNYVPPQLQAAAGGNAHRVFVNAVNVSGSIPLRGGVGTPFTPNFASFLKASNYKETIGASSSIYALDTAAQSGMTIYKYIKDSESNDYQLIPATGVRGNFSAAWEIEKEPIGTFSGMGISADDLSAYRTYFNAADEPALDYDGGAYTYTGVASRDSAPKLTCSNMVLTVGGTSYPAMSASFDSAWTPSPVTTLQAAATASKILLTKNNTTRSNGQIMLLDGAAALTDAKSKWASGAEAALVITCDNGSASMTFEAENIQLGHYSLQNQNGLYGASIPFFVVAPDEATDLFGEGWAKFTFAA